MCCKINSGSARSNKAALVSHAPVPPVAVSGIDLVSYLCCISRQPGLCLQIEAY